MEIHIVGKDGASYIVHVKDSDVIALLHDRIETQNGIEPVQPYVIYEGKANDVFTILREYGIYHNPIVCMTNTTEETP